VHIIRKLSKDNCYRLKVIDLKKTSINYAGKIIYDQETMENTKENANPVCTEEAEKAKWAIPILTVVVAGLFSLFGAWIGSTLQSRSENQLEVAKARNAALSDVYKFQIETTDYPEEILSAQRASKVVSYITLATAGTISSIASVLRKSKGCTDFMKTDCQIVYLSEIEVERAELGIDRADRKDLEDVLRGPFQAMGIVSRGRNSDPVILSSPREISLHTDDIPALKNPFPAAFSARFPSKQFVLAVDTTAVDENRPAVDEKKLTRKTEHRYTICTAVAGMSIQPARGFNPRIPVFRSVSVARVPLKAQLPTAKKKCLIDAADDAVRRLLTMDPNTIPVK
jgi:hypothetical protein